MTGVSHKEPLDCGCATITHDDGSTTSVKCETHKVQRLPPEKAEVLPGNNWQEWKAKYEAEHERAEDWKARHAGAQDGIGKLLTERDALAPSLAETRQQLASRDVELQVLRAADYEALMGASAEDLAALRRALGVTEDAATEEMVMAALGMRERVRELEHAKCGDTSTPKGPTDV